MADFFKKKNKKINISAGLTYVAGNPMERGSRLLLLLAKGAIIYLITGGLLGALLSTVNIEYSQFFVQIFILIIALLGSLIYYSKLTRNVIYIVFLVIFIYAAIKLRDYINSGFYAVINEMSIKASNYFGSSTIHKFGEPVQDRYMAVTYCMIFLGSILSILINMVTTKKARIGITLIMSFFLLAVPIYLNTEPKTGYIVMFLSGIFMTGILNSSFIYEIPDKNDSYIVREKRHNLIGFFDGRQIIILTAAVVFITGVTAFVSGRFVSNNKIKYRMGESSLKESTKETFENIYVVGLRYLFDRGIKNGGLTWGELGNVNKVSLDHETDLVVTFVPYTTERIYLTEYQAEQYVPFNNRWLQTVVDKKLSTGTANYTAYKNAYESGNNEVGLFKMHIGVVDELSMISYYQLPYYTTAKDWILNKDRTEEYYSQTEGTFYVYSGEEKIVGNTGLASDYLKVPDEIREVLGKICKEAGLNVSEVRSNPHIIEEKLGRFFQNNYTYSLKPGATPYGKDYITFFLNESKKGYCVHFATAATMISRYLGVPSRFVEGYAIDFDEVAMDGELLENEKIEDYQFGYNAFGGNTAVIKLEVNDGSAHAWSEIYIDGEGWIPLDVTPYSEEDEEEDESSLWAEFLDLMDNGGNNSENGNSSNGISDFIRNTDWKGILNVPLIILAAAAGGGVLFLTVRFVIIRIRFYKADRNKKLMMLYERLLRRKIKDAKIRHDKLNFREQVKWMAEMGMIEAWDEELDKIIRILEKAAYSQYEIEEEEYCMVKSTILKK